MRLSRLVIGCVMVAAGAAPAAAQWINQPTRRRICHPHSEALHVTERFRRTNSGSMQLEITCTDPKTHTKPFSVKLPVLYQGDTDLIEKVARSVLAGDELEIQMAPDAPRLPTFALSDTPFVPAMRK